jgi:hypothetical protein
MKNQILPINLKFRIQKKRSAYNLVFTRAGRKIDKAGAASKFTLGAGTVNRLTRICNNFVDM